MVMDVGAGASIPFTEVPVPEIKYEYNGPPGGVEGLSWSVTEPVGVPHAVGLVPVNVKLGETFIVYTLSFVTEQFWTGSLRVREYVYTPGLLVSIACAEIVLALTPLIFH